MRCSADKRMMGALEDSPHVSITKVGIFQDGATFWHPLGISKPKYNVPAIHEASRGQVQV